MGDGEIEQSFRFGVAVAILLAGCGSSEPAPPLLEKVENPIFGGSADTQNPAVMALLQTGMMGGACSGTNVRTSGTFGYLLTAAHCVMRIDTSGNVIVPIQPVPAGELLVVPGTDWQTGVAASTYYPVQSFVFPPQYNGTVTSAYDIAVVRYVGASAATAVMQQMTSAEDDLAVGTPLVYVGYGQTQSNPMNSVRFAVNKNVSSLTATSVTHSRQDGTGICSGDSGGPAIRTLAAGKRVAAVSSYSSGASCATGSGVSVRVSAHQTFIDTFLNTTPPAVSCDTCRSLATTTFGGCSSQARACATGTPCGQFVTCANACAPNDTACIDRCGAQNQRGAFDYRTFFFCGCNDCNTACSSDPVCDLPACGLGFSDTTCNGCNDTRCCTDTKACAEDFACFGCATSPTTAASCDTNALYQAFRRCNLTSCGTECGAACGFANTGACGDCINQTCCTQSRACALDGACTRCASSGGSTCSSNQLYRDFLSCLGQCPGNPCGGGAGGRAGAGGASDAGGAAGGTGGAAGAATGGTAGTAGTSSGGSAGTGARANADAGSVGGSAGSTTTGASSNETSSGCGCRTAPRPPRSLTELIALAALVVFTRRRRPIARSRPSALNFE